MTTPLPPSGHMAAPSTGSAKQPVEQTTDGAREVSDDAADQATPATPDERDQRSDMTGQVPSERIRQAADDVAEGRRDTSKGEESDAAYRRLRDG